MLIQSYGSFEKEKHSFWGRRGSRKEKAPSILLKGVCFGQRGKLKEKGGRSSTWGKWRKRSEGMERATNHNF